MSDEVMIDDNILEGKTLLVVDDENDLREIVASELEFMGAKVYQVENVTRAKKILQEKAIDLVVSDIRMPGGTGIDLLDFVKERNPHSPPVVLITGFADITAEDAYNKGAEALLNKPFKLDDLVHVVALHTSSPEQRLGQNRTPAKQQLELSFSETFKGAIRSGVISIGRGGISFSYEAKQNIDCSDTVDFVLRFSDTTLAGLASCRTMRVLPETKLHAIALEFLYLDESSLKLFLGELGDRKTIPFLPLAPSPLVP